MEAKPPNVIIVLTDDQGYGDMSCHGNEYINTPNIDRLHGESARFTDFHVDPTCSPTRAALMTGRYASRTGVWLTYMGRNHLRADEVTMGDVFRSAGYRTAVFGKWHLGDNYPFRPQDRGFDESLIHSGGVVGETPDIWGNDYYDDTYLRNGQPEEVDGYCTDVWFREAMQFIRSNSDQPFFVYLATNAPHGPFHVPEKYVKPHLGRKGIPEHRARFYGMLAAVDENVGKMRDGLDKLGLADDTVIVYLTDNGTTAGVGLKAARGGRQTDGFPVSGFNAGMRGKKGSAYEGGHRVACFVHWRNGGISKGTDIPQLSAHFDLLPTLIDLCGLPLPNVDFDGTSLKPLLKGSFSWNDRTLLVHHQGRFGQKITDDRPVKYKAYSVMTDRWRLVGDELYDRQADPGQRKDIAAEHPEVATRLKEDYEKWWADISTRFDEYCRTIVGSDKQAKTVLTSQAWHGDDCPYNQQHVRSAMQANGFWDVTVAQSGTYEIALRRWPEELNISFDATVQLGPLDPAKLDTHWRLFELPSRPILAKTARLKVEDFDESRPIPEDSKSVTFRVHLKGGDADIQTWLTTEEGNSWGAYYVTVKRIEPPEI